MIAITPMPPTINATLESTIITRKNTPVSRLNTLRISSDVMRSNVLGSPGRWPLIRRSWTVTASIARATVMPSRGLTRMMSELVSSYRNDRSAVRNGRMAEISWPGG